REHARGAAARTVRLGVVGVAVPPVQCIKVTRLVRGMNRHAGEARLFQVVNARGTQRFGQGQGHGDAPLWGEDSGTSEVFLDCGSLPGPSGLTLSEKGC